MTDHIDSDNAERTSGKRQRAKAGDMLGSVYHHTATLGRGYFSQLDAMSSMVPDRFSEDLGNPQVLESLASMLVELLNNVYARYNQVAQRAGVTDSVPRMSWQFHLDPQGQLQEIRDQVSYNGGTIEAMADQAGIGGRIRQAVARMEDGSKRETMGWAWMTLHRLSCIQSTPGHPGYDHEDLDERMAQVMMLPSRANLGHPSNPLGVDLLNSLELLQWKIRHMSPLGRLLHSRGDDQKFHNLVCQYLRYCNTVGRMDEIMKMLETDAPAEWIIASMQSSGADR